MLGNIGWIVAVALALLNLIVAYLVIPTKTKVTNLREEFIQYREKGVESLENLRGITYHQGEISKGHSASLTALSECVIQMKSVLAEIKADSTATKESVQRLESRFNEWVNGRIRYDQK